MTRDGGSGGPQWIGILGGGQLGRMLAIAAAQLGLKTHIYAPDANTSPAGEVATCTTSASYDDMTALRAFAAGMGFGDTSAYGRWQMDNLLGQHMVDVPSILASEGANLHLYGKPEARTDRKMGHVTRRLID